MSPGKIIFMATLPIKEAIARTLSEALSAAAGRAVTEAEVLLSLETPKEEKFGDLSTHYVLKLAKEKKTPPRTLAEEVKKSLEAAIQQPGLLDRVAKISVEGPGFINFYYSIREIAAVLSRVRAEGDSFGKPKSPGGKKILLEFVSANPTGPLTIAHGRQAALGDSLARILSFLGHSVTREYYNNDEGVQIETLGRSTHLRLRELWTGQKIELPENYYRGEYLIETAAKLDKEKGAALKKMSEAEQVRECTTFAKEDILKGIQKDLLDFGVTFDHYFSQASLMRSGAVEKALEALRKKGFVYEKEGAVWFESTRLGDDKDRVLIKSDKTYTYLTPDIAYHENKLNRKYDLLINILGPDHHGYIPRIKASVEALGYKREQLEILIAQLVTLFEGGQQVRMSTRAGEFVTLREIMDEVGRDAGRFFFLMRKFDAHLDFDLALAKSQTPDNPVFYIQYAHARIESVKRTFEEKGGRVDLDSPAGLGSLKDPLEIKLMQLLSQFESTVEAAGRTLEPYRLVPYLMELAAAFHRFYTENRVVTEDAELTQGRIKLVAATQQVLKNGLSLLGVSAPQKM